MVGFTSAQLIVCVPICSMGTQLPSRSLSFWLLIYMTCTEGFPYTPKYCRIAVCCSAVRSAPSVATTLESALAGNAGIPATRTSAAAPAISLLMNLFFMLTTSLSTLFILLYSFH